VEVVSTNGHSQTRQTHSQFYFHLLVLFTALFNHIPRHFNHIHPPNATAPHDSTPDTATASIIGLKRCWFGDQVDGEWALQIDSR